MIAGLVLLPIFGYATLFYIFAKRSVSVSIFFSISSIITTLFIFGMVDLLKLSTYLLFYGGIVLLIAMSILFPVELKKGVKSLPFIIYTVISLIYLYFIKDAHLFFWDEYSHWGIFIKEMYFFDRFYDTTSVAAHLNYPPAISIWDYFVVKPTGYSEGSLYFAYFLILFSSTLMMYEKLSFKQVHWIVSIFFMQMVIFAGFGHWFSSIYVDHVVGAMFAGLILSFLVDKFTTKELPLFIFPLISIVLIKEIGLYFGLSSLLFFLIYYILEYQKGVLSYIRENIKTLVILIMLALSMVIVLKAWGIRQEGLGVHKEKQTITGIAKALLSDKKVLSPEKEAEVKKRFWEVVFLQQLHKEKVSLNYNEFSYGTMSKYTKSLKLSTIGVFIFFILLCAVAYFSTYSKRDRRRVSIFGSYFLFISIIYLFILYFSFLVAFGNGASRIPSFVRYMNISIMPMLFIGFSFYLPIFRYKDKKESSEHKSFIAFIVMVALLAFIVRPYFKPLYSQIENGFRKNADVIANSVLTVVPPKSKLFVIFLIRNNGSLNNILKYSLVPIRATISGREFSKKSSEEMINIYKNYDYIWFSSINKEIFNKNRNILRLKNKQRPFTIYKIEKNSDKISIKPVM